MREIKFRAKTTVPVDILDDYGLKHDNGWIYGVYLDEFIISGVDEANDEYITINNWCSVNPETVGQYVEILDAYEGDILYGCEKDEIGHLMSSWLGQVKYNESRGRIMIYDIYEGDWYEVDDYMADKVIGNVFDNPELLEVKE